MCSKYPGLIDVIIREIGWNRGGCQAIRRKLKIASARRHLFMKEKF